MLKKILLLLVITMTIIFSLSLIKIDQSKKESIIMNKIEKRFIPFKQIQEKPIGELTIEKINLKNDLYSINSNKNNVEENVTILKESSYPQKMFIAAHSGEGKIAYFNEIDQLSIHDTIILNYYDDTKIYQIEDINYMEKNGYIRIPKSDQNILVLTTCDRNSNHKQLIISCIEKEL